MTRGYDFLKGTIKSYHPWKNEQIWMHGSKTVADFVSGSFNNDKNSLNFFDKKVDIHFKNCFNILYGTIKDYHSWKYEHKSFCGLFKNNAKNAIFDSF